uniref:Uncharacterized protein n=1 Tax=Erythrolobus madagascarensis TaxID=708628 RepID=A0A7S0T6T9_9RHOD|mmetsp:Transcript_2791/g.6104  ORF Transcript_2791/g.6104 Transcript_2791/m.6104 type:complete len:226 (+) Transcript_2791:84-761(+)
MVKNLAKKNGTTWASASTGSGELVRGLTGVGGETTMIALAHETKFDEIAAEEIEAARVLLRQAVTLEKKKSIAEHAEKHAEELLKEEYESTMNDLARRNTMKAHKNKSVMHVRKHMAVVVHELLAALYEEQQVEPYGGLRDYAKPRIQGAAENVGKQGEHWIESRKPYFNVVGAYSKDTSDNRFRTIFPSFKKASVKLRHTIEQKQLNMEQKARLNIDSPYMAMA